MLAWRGFPRWVPTAVPSISSVLFIGAGLSFVGIVQLVLIYVTYVKCGFP